jgi:hypothetical protein
MFVSTAFYDGEQALTKIMTTDDEENESFVCRRKEMTKTVSYISHEGKQNGIQIPVPYNRPTSSHSKHRQNNNGLYNNNPQIMNVLPSHQKRANRHKSVRRKAFGK